MVWPQATDYVEAVQNLAASVRDSELRAGRMVENAIGLPVTNCGAFATVFRCRKAQNGAEWALKCFTRNVPNLQRRYREIAQHLDQHARLPFMVRFRYIPEGILVRGHWYAVLKMDWVDGLRLDEFLDNCIQKEDFRAKLQALCTMWLRLARMLREAQVGHGDLQHGNVLLVRRPGKKGFDLKLIDYDGMFVPALAEEPPDEIGHAAFQHPARSLQNGYGLEIDRFSHLLIYWTLRCLMVGGEPLWKRYYNGERLLVEQKDLSDPANSAVFSEVWRLPDAALQSLTGHLLLALRAPLERVPLLEEVVRDGEVIPLSDQQHRELQRWLGNGAAFSAAKPRAAREEAGRSAGGGSESPRPQPAERKRPQRKRRPAPESSLEERLREWIKNGKLPSDHYELLGMARWHPHREDLFAAGNECYRVLHACQNHPEPQLAERARNLQMRVAEAMNTFSNDALWQEYDTELIVEWRKQFAVKGGRDPTRWHPLSLRRWLESRRVHPTRLEQVLLWMTSVEETEAPPEQQAEPKPKTQRRASFRTFAFAPPPTAAPKGNAANPAKAWPPREFEAPAEPQLAELTPLTAEPENPQHYREEGKAVGKPERDSGVSQTPLPGQLPAAAAPGLLNRYPSWLWWLIGSVATSVLLCIVMALIVLVWLLSSMSNG